MGDNPDRNQSADDSRLLAFARRLLAALGGDYAAIGGPFTPSAAPYLCDVCHKCGIVAPIQQLEPLEGPDGSIYGFECEEHY